MSEKIINNKNNKSKSNSNIIYNNCKKFFISNYKNMGRKQKIIILISFFIILISIFLHLKNSSKNKKISGLLICVINNE